MILLFLAKNEEVVRGRERERKKERERQRERERGKLEKDRKEK